MTNQAKLGCVIGRFQLDELHEGHLKLLGEVSAQHSSLLILVGCSEAQPDNQDPLDFEIRRTMLNSYFPKAFVLPLYDHPSNTVWSKQIDTAIATVSPRGDAVLYGSRDSFIPSYEGRYNCTEVEQLLNVSASEIREHIAKMKGESTQFRQGVIWARANQYPVSFQAVDAVLIKPKPYAHGEWLVALGKRSPEDELWRFPGGIVDPADTSLEAAVKRELSEEMGSVETGDAKYLGSRKVNDFRYRSSTNSIMTACFLFNFVFGPLVPGDDLKVAEWHNVKNLPKLLVPEHQMLAEMLNKHLEHNKQTVKEIEHVE